MSPTSERAQSTLEMAVLTAVIAAALLGMQVYMKRGISGRWRDALDSLGSQYAPRHTTSLITTTERGTTRMTSTLQPRIGPQAIDVMQTTVTIDPTNDNPQQTTRTGSETVGPLTSSLWND